MKNENNTEPKSTTAVPAIREDAVKEALRLMYEAARRTIGSSASYIVGVQSFSRDGDVKWSISHHDAGGCTLASGHKCAMDALNDLKAQVLPNDERAKNKRAEAAKLLAEAEALEGKAATISPAA